LVDK
jgi:hypothetical protein